VDEVHGDEDLDADDLDADDVGLEDAHEEDAGEELGDEADDGSPGERAKHRKIPTWNEAVSLVVDVNMESRSRRDDRRGRGRGGRR
jgi:hypothetical protein